MIPELKTRFSFFFFVVEYEPEERGELEVKSVSLKNTLISINS